MDSIEKSDEVIKVIKTERECVKRNEAGSCNRQCAMCDLLLDTNRVLDAYDYTIALLEWDKKTGSDFTFMAMDRMPPRGE